MDATANFETYTISEAVEKLSGFQFVLPSFQRRVVWKPKQIVDLFNTIIQNDILGSISAIKQISGQIIFKYYRDFDKSEAESLEYSQNDYIGRVSPIYYIIDGQQRLTSLYRGLAGNLTLYYNLLDCSFSLEKDRPLYGLKVSVLSAGIKSKGYEKYAEEIVLQFTENQTIIKEAIFKFYYSFFFNKTICISLIYANELPEADINSEKEVQKKRFIDLFVKLNTGGTNLSRADVALCTLKGYCNGFEHIIDTVYEINSRYEGFSTIFVNSLVLFRKRSEIKMNQKGAWVSEDSLNPHYDYQDIYFLKDDDNSNLKFLELKNNENFDYVDSIMHNQNNLIENITTINEVLIFSKNLLTIINHSQYCQNKVFYLTFLPILLTRLYYSRSDFELNIVAQKVSELHNSKCVALDLCAINELKLENFYKL